MLLKIIISFLAVLLLNSFSYACTRILLVSDEAVLVGRNMDWIDNPSTDILIYPRGLTRHGSLDDNNSIDWVARYGSVVATVYDHLATDGLNEQGLAGHILWLNEADYGERDLSKTGLSVSLWLQYYLDNFSSVREAVAFTQQERVQVLPYYIPEVKQWAKLHLILEDASGDSAIIEVISAGKTLIFHDQKNQVATNSPTYDLQLLNLQNYNGFGGQQPLPGSSKPTDRFVRAAYYLGNLPRHKTVPEELAGVITVLNNAAQPFTIPTAENPLASQTLWHSIADLTHRIYYFQEISSQHLLWLNLEHFDLQAGAPTLTLDLPHHPEYVGEIEEKFGN